MGAAMAEQDHKLISTPVSVNDGFKRADARTWFVLMIAAVAAVAVVVLINLFVEKPNVRWPSSPARQAAPPAAEPANEEPRSYDVAPPGAVPAPPGSN
jgi:hypothetical protein